MSIQQLVDNARLAVAEIKDYDQAQTDELVNAIGNAIIEHDVELAEEAVEETKMGNVPTKIAKNRGMAESAMSHLAGKKSVGILERDEVRGITKVAHPVGVVASVTPMTNPTITPLANATLAFKGKNAVIVSPHPRAAKTTIHSIEIMRDALEKIGAPKDLIQVIEEPTVSKSQELMSLVDIIVATGGPSMVKSAYSSGKPAYGVGPGNVQTILDSDFDLKRAAEIVIEARNFDHGIVCSSTQALIYPAEKQAGIIEELEKAGAYYVSDHAEIARFRELLLPDGVQNPAYIGKSAVEIAKALDITVPETTKIIALEISDLPADDVLIKEKLSPVLTMKKYNEFDEALKIARAHLDIEGIGHTVGILSNTREHIERVGLRLPVSRVMVNQPSSDAAGSPHNGLNPSASLGCGSWGNNIISENLTFKHLLNIIQIVDYIN